MSYSITWSFVLILSPECDVDGGSVVQNGLDGTRSDVPATVDQIPQYLKDVKSGKVRLTTGRVLHYFNSGINPVNQIWYNLMNAGMSAQKIAQAKASVTANTQAAAKALRLISKDSTLLNKAHGVDFVLVGIPPLEIIPTSAYQVPANFTSAERSEALRLIKELCLQWNSEIELIAKGMKVELKNSKVFFYDLSSLVS